MRRAFAKWRIWRSVNRQKDANLTTAEKSMAPRRASCAVKGAAPVADREQPSEAARPLMCIAAG